MSAIKTLLLLLALLYAFHPSPLCEATVCYVKPTEPHNATCPSEPCYTLNEYVSNSTKYFLSNTVFMFLTGYHKLSYNLTVTGVYNITLRPYIEKSNVIIDSELQLSLTFELASDIVIGDVAFQTVGIHFENTTNVTLTGLRAENASITLNDVFGEVNISNLKSRNCHNYALVYALVCSWTVTQYIPNTVVLLHELDILGSFQYGVSISGCVPGNIVLSNSTFTNAWTGMQVNFDASCKETLVVCENTRFYKNTVGLDISVQLSLYHEHPMMTAVLLNVSFIGNYYALNLDNVQNVTISDCCFERSSFGGAISTLNTIVSLKGNVTFMDNHFTNSGGAISLSGNSRVLITESKSTHVLFENNTADNVGGAIYFSSPETEYVAGYCKIFVEEIPNKTIFSFVKNKAANGGNAIYGADLFGVYLNVIPCYSPNGTFVLNISQLLLSVSSFYPSFADDASVISSDPQTLCFCNEDGELGNCSGTYLYVYPGQVFGIPVAALGDMNGLVKWSVYATAERGKLGNEIQHSQITNSERCTYFQYSVLSTEKSVTLEFSLTGFQSIIDYRYELLVHLLDCPLGFSLSNNYGCQCHEYLLQSIENITCNVTEQSIQRQGTTWIGVLENSTGTTTLAFSNVCPFLYCEKLNAKILVHNQSFLNEDIQCTGNRSGVLCGGCRDSFSLALGSSRCLHGCSNNSISLIIAFVAAGIALVFFIKILNLTVSQGTINGLVFYANIVGAEQTVLFSSRAYEGFLSVFIAWVNLDLGFETCFFDGMDAYSKAWLQFVFPVYVWVIALFIIIFSHYSIRASKLFGNNSVPVLVTLILLSYSKLLRAVISALSITDIRFLNGSTMSVWERDGNIQYLTGKHIPLFVFAIALLILLWFPFTLILVSIQWLQRGTHYRVLHWVTKLRPFFDAYTGPLKDKHRYWVGALLLARCSLLLVFYVYTANGNGVAFISIILATLIILVFLAATGFVYRNYFLTVLELSYILNLGILATGTLYVQYINDKGNQEALVMTSVGIAFLQFIATVIYHAYVQLREPLTKLNKKIVGIGSQEDADITTDYGSLNVAAHVEQPIQRPSYQEMSNYREPLLAYLSD